jgi:hypothetical protein
MIEWSVWYLMEVLLGHCCGTVNDFFFSFRSMRVFGGACVKDKRDVSYVKWMMLSRQLSCKKSWIRKKSEFREATEVYYSWTNVNVRRCLSKWWKPIDCGYSDRQLTMSQRGLAVSNQRYISSSETTVNARRCKLHLPEWSWCQESIGGICFTIMWRAASLGPSLGFDNFKPPLKRISTVKPRYNVLFGTTIKCMLTRGVHYWVCAWLPRGACWQNSVLRQQLDKLGGNFSRREGEPQRWPLGEGGTLLQQSPWTTFRCSPESPHQWPLGIQELRQYRELIQAIMICRDIPSSGVIKRVVLYRGTLCKGFTCIFKCISWLNDLFFFFWGCTAGFSERESQDQSNGGMAPMLPTFFVRSCTVYVKNP